ncbi:MAG: MerR family transcriptional regulator [Alphaproteobacteria bacterium]|nr:MerR family transcriptional regulator [Alphaproteobacteria bacterium]
MDLPQGEGLSIGRLARRSGIQVETIHYYERCGLMRKPERTGGGHHTYRADGSDRLRFIRRARQLGFSLDDIGQLLELAGDPKGCCADAAAITRAHLATVRAKIVDLQRVERALAALVPSSDQRLGGCQILAALSVPTEADDWACGSGQCSA